MVCNVITADKANRLFWLGRYAERVYISLHLLRRYYDSVLDGDMADIREYYKLLGVDTFGKDQNSEEFQLSQLYSADNACSIMISLINANDNGIVLRRDITSESLSYLQMSKALLDDCAISQVKNISMLQPITDYMLAFFGSIDERVFDERIRKFLKIGRFIENIDLHIRFNYPFFRIEEVFLSLKENIANVGAVVDAHSLEQLEALLCEEKYHPESDSYRELVLGYINYLVIV